jgi:hypothetical protein
MGWIADLRKSGTMCITRITNEIIDDSGFGWKVYLRDSDGNLRCLHQKDIVHTDKWLKADKVKSALGYCPVHTDNLYPDYRHGFHLYFDFLEAYRFASEYLLFTRYDIVVKYVQYRKLICSGRGYKGSLEIVADEIFIQSGSECALVEKHKEDVSTGPSAESCIPPEGNSDSRKIRVFKPKLKHNVP